jgi:hypothetical protein
MLGATIMSSINIQMIWKQRFEALPATLRGANTLFPNNNWFLRHTCYMGHTVCFTRHLMYSYLITPAHFLGTWTTGMISALTSHHAIKQCILIMDVYVSVPSYIPPGGLWSWWCDVMVVPSIVTVGIACIQMMVSCPHATPTVPITIVYSGDSRNWSRMLSCRWHHCSWDKPTDNHRWEEQAEGYYHHGSYKTNGEA